MTEVRDLSSNAAVGSDSGTIQPHNQYGLFATTAYSEGDEILTESPLVVSTPGDVRFQFLPSSLVTATPAAAASSGKAKGNGDDEKPSSSSILSDLLLPPTIVEKLPTGNSTSKLRGMLLALASYAANPPSEETKTKLFELYHPSTNEKEDKEEKDVLQLAKLALQCGQKMAAPESALSSLLKNTDDNELMLKLLLIYSCNAFEGGMIYHGLSRVNHSCNPNAVVAEGDSSRAKNDVSVLKAACDIAPGEEICISYLGKYLYAGYPIRQRMLRANKHFVCRCTRCKSNTDKEDGEAKSDQSANNNGDLASRIPCPICHPRTGRYLDEDVMFDEDANDEDGLTVSYAIPSNGLTAEERSLYCPSCKGTTAVGADGSMREKKEGLAIKYMCKAEDKIFDHLEDAQSGNDKKKQQKSGDDTDTEREIDQQFFQMATSVCGAQHWTTHFLNLSMIEESLASFHSTLMTMGQDPSKDKEMMEDLMVEIAEAADGIEQAQKFASSLNLNLDPAHWLFDYTVGLARTLVGLGDEKSQKYGSTWIKKVESYSENFENDGMNKVVVALRDAWKRGKTDEAKTKSGGNVESKEGQKESKRRKVG